MLGVCVFACLCADADDDLLCTVCAAELIQPPGITSALGTHVHLAIHSTAILLHACFSLHTSRAYITLLHLLLPAHTTRPAPPALPQAPRCSSMATHAWVMASPLVMWWVARSM